MKFFRLLTLCIAVLCLGALVACGAPDATHAPHGVTVEYETLTLRWNETEGAKTYTVRIEPQGGVPSEQTVSKTYYSLASFAPGKYSLSVRANGAGGENSQFSRSVDFDREEENGLLFRLVDGKEYEVSGKGSATGVIEIPATYRKKPVTSVGEKAFFNASDLTAVKLPESVRSIGAFAFANCAYLESITLPQNLASLGESAFSGCRMLGGAITLPDSLTEIPKGAFAYCSSLTEVHFGKNLAAIGENAFTDCSDIRALAFPKTLKTVGGFAFAACADVAEVSFSEGLTTLGEFAFSKALSLSSVTLPESLQTVGKGAFYHCSALSSVTLGTGVTEIGDAAFLDTAVYQNSQTNEIYVGNWFLGLRDASATVLDIREGTVGIANNALYANRTLSSVELPNSVKYIGANAFAVSDIISIVTGSGVERIGDQAFLYCEKLLDVALGSYDYVDHVIKESALEYIGNYAFMNCTRLARIEIPDSVQDIGAYAFRNTELFSSAMTGAVYADKWIVDFNKTITEDVTVDKGTVGIARYAFYNCTALKSIRLDSSVKYLCRGAFYNCTSLETVIFPDTLAKIGDYAFYSCSSLRLTSLPPMLREIGRAAFYRCGTVENNTSDTANDRLEIPAGVTHIGDFAFYGCGYRRADAMGGRAETVGIDSIVMGDAVEYIGKCAFRDFVSLRSLTVAGTAMIGDKAFYGCSSLEEVTVLGKLTDIGEKAFYRCTSLHTVNFPDTLKTVGKYAFYQCTALNRVMLGNALESIGDFAFCGDVSLSCLTLPSSLHTVGAQAFRGCSALTSLTLGRELASVGAHAFYACDALTLYIASRVAGEGWDACWNSTFVPALWGCILAEDGYVLYFAGDVLREENLFTDTVLSAPTREGYIFLGLSSTSDSETAEYTLPCLATLEKQETLYTVWRAAD